MSGFIQKPADAGKSMSLSHASAVWSLCRDLSLTKLSSVTFGGTLNPLSVVLGCWFRRAPRKKSRTVLSVTCPAVVL